MTMAATLYGPGQDRQDRFQLNDMSFAGPVIMGIGGKYYKGYNCFYNIVLLFY